MAWLYREELENRRAAFQTAILAAHLRAGFGGRKVDVSRLFQDFAAALSGRARAPESVEYEPGDDLAATEVKRRDQGLAESRERARRAREGAKRNGR